MPYETAARAARSSPSTSSSSTSNRRAPIRSKGGELAWVYWGTGAAHLLPRLLRLPDGTSRSSGPLFLASRAPVPARRPGSRDICPHTGRPRLGYDRARILLKQLTGCNCTSSTTPQPPTSVIRKSALLALIMAKTRHKAPRTVMRYVNPGPAAVAAVTQLLDPAPDVATDARAGVHRPRAP